ncbi:MAG: tetratricopeptide repeat protein, partial [Deltaproteobacteria bacterium]|nr:tetratricopeptide repeat protein [Deltaproteobacteria bacterium]
NIFTSLIEAAPENPVGYYQLGLVDKALGQFADALSNFDKALSITPRFVDVFTNVILVHAAQKEFSKALAKCDRQLELYSDSPALSAVVHHLKGGLYLAQDKKTAAIDSFQAAIKENPNYLRPYYGLARIYLDQGQEDKAIAQYSALLKLNPNQAQPHMLLGVLYDTQQRFDLSEKHYRAALEINPEFVAAANNLAFILADQEKDLNKALELAQSAKERLPNSPYVMDTLGWVYYKKGLYDLAIVEFSDALEKLPNNAPIVYHLGMAYNGKGDNDKARTELKKALRLDANFPGADEARKLLAEM